MSVRPECTPKPKAKAGVSSGLNPPVGGISFLQGKCGVYFFVYILKCADGSYYTGHTDNLEKRIGEHKSGMFDCYTLSRRPVEVVFVQHCSSRY